MRIDLRRAEPAARRTIPILLAAELVLFVLLTIAVASAWPALLHIDTRVADSAYAFSGRHQSVRIVCEALAFLFTTLPVLVAAVIAAVVAYYRGYKSLGTWIGLSVVATVLINPAAKLLIGRSRPAWESPLIELGGYSYPSGHAAAAGAIFTICALIAVASTQRGLKRRLLVAACVAAAVLVAASRVLLGVHYLSDVVAGLCLGSAITLALWLVVVHGTAPLPARKATATGSGSFRCALILNPVKVGDSGVFVEKVAKAAEAHGWHAPIVFETTVEDPGYGQAREALETAVDLIIAAGGDGTVRAVCEVAARSGTAVGILPHGTGNLLARNLDIPLNLLDALDVVFGGQDQAIDLASFETDTIERTSFLVMAGLGLDAAIMAGVTDQLKNKVGYAAYFVAGVRAMMFPRTRVKVLIDDEEPLKFKARTVVVGNVGSLQGGITLLPEAAVDDGRLDVVVIAPKHFWGWIPIAWRILRRLPQNNKRLTRLSGQRIEITAERPVPMQLDGDHVGEGRHIIAEVAQGVVLVRVPADVHHS